MISDVSFAPLSLITGYVNEDSSPLVVAVSFIDNLLKQVEGSDSHTSFGIAIQFCSKGQVIHF